MATKDEPRNLAERNKLMKRLSEKSLDEGLSELLDLYGLKKTLTPRAKRELISDLVSLFWAKTEID